MDRTPEHNEGEITMEEARKNLHAFSFLEKPYQFGQLAMDEAIQECNLSEYLAIKLTRMTGRDGLHVLRLLRRTESERNFAIAYLQYRDKVFTENQELSALGRAVIGSEGTDIMMFWTFAPYIFKSLTQKGITPEIAIKYILLWSKDGVSVVTMTSRKGRDSSIDSMHLKGLEKYRTTIPQGWVLDKDPKHISHQFTEQEADSIADMLIAENEK